MRCHSIWILVGLTIIGLLVFSSISFAEEGKWRKRADMPTVRYSLSTSAVNGKIYAIGGVPGPSPTVEEYDPATNKWMRKADMPTPRWGLSTSVVNGKIYAIGGFVGGFPGGPVATVEEYDPITDTWTKKANMSAARSGLSTSVVNGKIYVIGGFDRGRSLVEEYEPTTDTWTKKANMPTERWNFSTSVVDGKIYAIGGTVGIPVFSTVEEYDPTTDTWRKRDEMPTARWGLATSVIDDKIYAIGGSKEGGGRWSSLSIVEVYDPMKNRWTKGKNMPTARWALSSNVANGKIYAIGGAEADGQQIPVRVKPLSTVEEYDPGFAGEAEGVEAKWKFVTSWGKIKAKY